MATEVVCSVVDFRWDIPRFWGPVGVDMEFGIVYFFGDERSSCKIDFCVEIFFESGEGLGYFTVGATGDWDEFKA